MMADIDRGFLFLFHIFISYFCISPTIRSGGLSSSQNCKSSRGPIFFLLRSCSSIQFWFLFVVSSYSVEFCATKKANTRTKY
ncbi:hypothetical protein VTI28DRAFT_4776 [Corynascus sepedonium]